MGDNAFYLFLAAAPEVTACAHYAHDAQFSILSIALYPYLLNELCWTYSQVRVYNIADLIIIVYCVGNPIKRVQDLINLKYAT